MRKVLIVSQTESSAKTIGGLIDPALYDEIASCNGAAAKVRALRGEYDTVIFNVPLEDCDGIALAGECARQKDAAVILLLPEKMLPQVEATCEENGILVVTKPVVRILFSQALRLAGTIQHRLQGLRSENEKLRVELGEMKLINRAKCVLISYLGITEPMAHRYIEKQAMDLRISRRQVAENILKTYEQ